MLKKICMLVTLCIAVIIIACGCRIVESDTEEKNDVDYTVASYDDVPEEVRKIIDEKKENEFSTIISDKENTYIVVGYGKRNTGGYTIKLKDIFESSTDVFVRLEFEGPKQSEEKDMESYPFIIIKIEYTQKNINVMK